MSADVPREPAPDTPLSDRFRLIGVDVSALTVEQAVVLILDAPRLGQRLGVHFVTAHTLVEGSRSEDLRAALNGDALVCPDGMPLAWLGKLRRHRVERVYGPDTMLAVMDRGRANGYRHFLYGGADGVADLLAERLVERFPGLLIAGTHTPPFRPLTAEEDRTVVDEINAANADFVWVGLGSPKQDYWVAEHVGRIEAGALLAVGAAFDFHSGRVAEAPGWMKRSGLQWFHRLLQEPGRLWKRYTVVNSQFIWLAGVDTLRLLARRMTARGR